MGFHEGELAVQERAGVLDQAARLEGMLESAELRGGADGFLRDRNFVVLTARAVDGRLWTSLVVGPPGFLEGHGTVLRINGRPGPGDPLRDVAAGQRVGMLAIDLANRRRIRINGSLSATGPDRLEVSVREAFGNCPQYIHPRRLDHLGPTQPAIAPVTTETELRPSDIDLIGRADTFFLGTTHPDRGPDASHRGGPPGFVRVENGALVWPDFPGNNMFNSFGNLAIDRSAALLFVDFAAGSTLQISGSGAVEWEGRNVTGRQVRVRPERVVASSVGLRERSHRNLAVT